MVRFILLVLLLLLSLLTVFPAPAFHLWLAAILVGELPWAFILVTALLMVTGYRFGKYQLPGTMAGILAVVLFLGPVTRAYLISFRLPERLTAAFGPAPAAGSLQPYNLLRSFYYERKKVPFTVIPYVAYQDITLSLDFYPAQAAGRRPCIVVVHGGSWKGGNSRQIPELNGLLARKGYHVAAINYRKVPQYLSPAPVEDVRNALFYLRKHAQSLGIDTNQFVLLGRSAGAQVALLAAYTLHDPAIKGVIDFYGPADMVWGYSVPANPLVMDSRKVMEDYLGGTYNQVPQQYTASSPLEFVTKQSPPTLILHGQNDPLVAYDHSRRLNEKLQRNGIAHFWLQLPWATHGFDYIRNGPGGQLANYAIERFLQSVTR